MTVVEWIAEGLVRLGVRHVFGVGGANVEDLFLAVQRRRPKLRAIACKHEHGAGTAADAYARLSGGLGVAMVTSGGGALNLVHSLAEGAASRVRWLALVGEPPTDQQGCGAFQDTSGRAGSVDALAVYRAITPDCTRLREASEIFAWFGQLLNPPSNELPRPIVLLLAKDLQRTQVTPPPDFWDRELAPQPPARAASGEVEALARALGDRAVTLLVGAEVARAGAQPELARLARALDAGVAVTPDARDAFDNASKSFLGVAGAMGHGSANHALGEAPALLLIGTRLPLLARQGLNVGRPGQVIVSIGREPPFVEHAAHVLVPGSLRTELDGFARRFEQARPEGVRVACADTAAAAVAPADAAQPLGMRAVLDAVAAALPDGSTLVIDAGNTGASAVHQLPAPRAGRWLLALGMAGMGYSFGAALGAALATGRRVFAIAGDGAFFMHGLELHTALEYALPITYLVLDNAAHGMCLVREQLLLGESSGYNSFRRSRLGAGLRAMLPGLPSVDCQNLEELHQALAQPRSGPCCICASLPDVEIPPFAAFQAARIAGATRVDRGERT